MLARAMGPFAAAVYAATVGYGMLLWTLVALAALAAALAYRAESSALTVRQRSQAASSSSASGST